MGSLFRLPDESILKPLVLRFPGREEQIRTLAILIQPDAAGCRNIVLHGTEATGKSAITAGLLTVFAAHRDAFLDYAIVNAAQCTTGRQLFERIVGAVADAVAWHTESEGKASAPASTASWLRRCESLAQLTVALRTMLRKTREPREQRRFVLVLDAIDRQRDAPPTLLPALARLCEIIPGLTCVFIVTSPSAGLLRSASYVSILFAPYTKAEYVKILSLTPPSPPNAETTTEETSELWTRFCAAVHDALVHAAGRTLTAFRHGCYALWPRFTAPIVAGTHTAREFSRLLVSARALLQDEALLVPSIIARQSPQLAESALPHDAALRFRTTQAPTPLAAELIALLPVAARLLLLCGFLASHNASRHDLSLFSTFHHHKRGRRRRGGAAATSRQRHRKIARRLLGAHAFVLERMLAIFEAVRSEWEPEGIELGRLGLDGDVAMALTTLASLRLLARVGAGDIMDRAGKWRIYVSWEAVRAIGRSIGVELEEWLID